jgi:hypothetical protein
MTEVFAHIAAPIVVSIAALSIIERVIYAIMFVGIIIRRTLINE